MSRSSRRRKGVVVECQEVEEGKMGRNGGGRKKRYNKREGSGCKTGKKLY